MSALLNSCYPALQHELPPYLFNFYLSGKLSPRPSRLRGSGLHRQKREHLVHCRKPHAGPGVGGGHLPGGVHQIPSGDQECFPTELKQWWRPRKWRDRRGSYRSGATKWRRCAEPRRCSLDRSTPSFSRHLASLTWHDASCTNSCFQTNKVFNFWHEIYHIGFGCSKLSYKCHRLFCAKRKKEERTYLKHCIAQITNDLVDCPSQLITKYLK